ncbi:MAG: cytochrome c biogenesis protein CcsA [Candidatus Marinimicrobia bacterium]|nr:cytochrome c biogenesis protein CcsA [Candidatus Neomarinimicrobiota bacterium]
MNFELYFLLVASLLFLISLFFSINFKKEKIGESMIFPAIFVQFLLLVVRSWSAKHPPFTNMYETMILLPFLFSLRLVLWKKQLEGNTRFGVIFLVLLLNMIAILVPGPMKEIRPLMPALNSPWMYIHVPSYFVAYSSMLMAAILAVMTLIRKDDLVLMKKLDEEVKIAFFFLNLGMITGAIWAYFSWGTYWGWDTKETWSLINILVLSYYFHVRKSETVSKAAIVIFTLLTIIFTYVGVTFILPGLHSYT